MWANHLRTKSQAPPASSPRPMCVIDPAGLILMLRPFTRGRKLSSGAESATSDLQRLSQALTSRAEEYPKESGKPCFPDHMATNS